MDTDESQDSRGKEGTIFYSSLPLPPTHEHLFATLHARWLSHIFNRTACIYQTAIWWDLPPYRITIWLIDDAMLIFVFLLDDLILGFCYNNLKQDTDGLELASTITLVLQTNRLSKCASSPEKTCNILEISKQI